MAPMLVGDTELNIKLINKLEQQLFLPGEKIEYLHTCNLVTSREHPV